MKLKQIFLWGKRFRYEIIALVFSAYGMYLRFSLLARRNLWMDEVSSLDRLLLPFRPIWQRYTYTDFTFFPGEYILNWPFAHIFGANKWGLAIPHIMITVLGFYLLYLICKRYLHSVFAWSATFALVAMNRDLVFHSLELRPYGVLPVLALAAFYFAEEIISQDYAPSLTRRILIGCLFIFTVIYQVYAAIVLTFIFVYFILRESGKGSFVDIFRHCWRFLLTMFVIGLPLYLWYSVGSTTVYKDSGYPGVTFQYIANPAVDLYGFLKTNICNLTGKKFLYPLAGFLLCPFVLPFKPRLDQIGFLLVLIVLPISLIFLVNILIGYHVLQRQYTWAMPLFAFLVGWCLDSTWGFVRSKFRHDTN